MEKVDVVIVGAGVVGLAIAAELSAQFESVVLIDKNERFGEETSSRNSEVIHAGIYYPKGSLKAKLCVEGKYLLYQHCDEYHVPYKKVGKLIVATSEKEEGVLAQIKQKSDANGVTDLTEVGQEELNKLEPNLSATKALFSPSTGIVDSHQYMLSLLGKFESNGGMFVPQTEFNNAEYVSLDDENHFVVRTTNNNEEFTFQTNFLINSAGLHASNVATSITGLVDDQIPETLFCRGHYFSYSAKSLFNHLIYPVPEQAGLGIHATLDMAGQVKFGPDTQYIDEIEYGVDGKLKDKFCSAIKTYFPEIDVSKLQPDYSGIRPKLVEEGEGSADFRIDFEPDHKVKGLVNLFGIESPGLTASLAIAKYIKQNLAT